MDKVVVQPLTVELPARYELETPFIPGSEPDPPVYILNTPVIPGVDFDSGAGPDDLDETYQGMSLSGPDHGLWHLDETYEPPTLTVFATEAIGFAPVIATGTQVQELMVGGVTIELDPVLV